MTPAQQRQVLAIAVVVAVAVAALGVHPTGATVIDALLVAASAAVVTWAAATAPWWTLAGAALVATAMGGTVVPIAVGLMGAVVAGWIGEGHRNMPWLRSISIGLTMASFALSTVHVAFGFTTAVACASLCIVFVLGARRKPRRVRTLIGRVALAAGGLAVVVTVGFALAAASSRTALTDGNRFAHRGLSALNKGDTGAAATAFAQAADAFRRADDDLSAVWAQPARLVPVVAQHRNAVAELADVAAHAMDDAATALRLIDPESVRVVNGRIDLDAVRALEAPFSQLHAAITDLEDVVDEHTSSWLAGPVQTRLADLHHDLDQNRFRAENALMAVQVAPQMLGADGARHYFVAFTTPAEARGLSGFMGNWAELTIDHGVIDMNDFGRSRDLTEGGTPDTRRIDGLDELLAHWGRFGLNTGTSGAADLQVWTNLTMVPDFPTFAEAANQLLPQSGRDRVDGVFMLDPRAIATLLRFTGPITVEGVDHPIDAQNAEQFILRDQYEVSNSERVDLLDEIAHTAVDALLSSSLPPPAQLADAFAPLAAQGRFLAWSPNAVEQQLLERVRLDGSFPALDGADGIAVTIDNGGANKIDAYLDTSVLYSPTSGTVTVTLTNKAPSSGLPGYVTGKPRPVGTNRLWLSVYTARPMIGVTLDGKPYSMQTDRVFGWNVASHFLDIPPGGTMVLTLKVGGTVERPDAPIVQRVQPLANDITVAVEP